MNTKNILIAESERGSANTLAHLLKSNDYQVTLARSIEETWTALTTERPELLLMEPMMPSGTEGFHLVWKLRQYPDGHLSQMPIIVLSKIHLTTNLNLFPRIKDGHYYANEFLPVQAFIDKPFDDRVLLETIGEVFGRGEILGRLAA